MLLRLVQYVRFRYPGNTDVFFFLSYMKNPHEFYQNIQPYPFLFPFFSATLKRVFRFSDRKLLLIGVIPDAITGLTAYLFMRSYFGMLTSLTALALFITTPALVHQSTFGPFNGAATVLAVSFGLDFVLPT